MYIDKNTKEGRFVMLGASLFAHIALGCTFGLFFAIYYINGDGKAKLFLELLLGLGGNAGGIFILYNTFKIQDTITNLISIAACLFSFLIVSILLIVIMAYVIKDEENDERNIIRLRDIIVGQTSWIKEFRDKRVKEIDEKLNYVYLKEWENQILQKENSINEKNKYINDEMDKLEELGNGKLRFLLPENSKVTMTREYIGLMPSYFMDLVRCVLEMNKLENQYLCKENDVDKDTFVAYLMAIASAIQTNIFSINSPNIRIHFRYYNKERNGYEKLIAISGKKILKQEMKFIPYDENNMIVKSYECKRALIKSINFNAGHKDDDNKIWKDYMTYTFLNMEIDKIPFLSFGISVKDDVRYKKVFYFINYMNFESFLQEKIEAFHNKYNLEYILYGEEK